MWPPVKGAEVYKTTAAQTDDVIHCNDTAPVCALSDLVCNTAYSVTVTPCSDLRGCNLTCAPQTHETGINNYVKTQGLTESISSHLKLALAQVRGGREFPWDRLFMWKMENYFLKHNYHNFANTHVSVLLQLHALQRSWIWCRSTTPHTKSISLPPTTPMQITPSLPLDTMTNTFARQETTRVSSHSCPAVQPMRSRQWPPQLWGEVYLDSVNLWKQVWLAIAWTESEVEFIYIYQNRNCGDNAKITLGASCLWFFLYPFFAFLAVMDQQFKAFYVHCINYQYSTNTIKYSKSKR